MKNIKLNIATYFLISILPLGGVAHARRAPAPPIKPILFSGMKISYEFRPSDAGFSAAIVAKKDGNDRAIWESTIYRRTYRDDIEWDIQYISLKSMKLEGDVLVAIDGAGQKYRLQASDGKLLSPKETKIYPTFSVSPESK